MKIFYFDGTKNKTYSAKNFGDELNVWLWKKVFPEISDVYPEICFVGIGTLLNERLPKESNKIIFGAGHGYGQIPVIDDTWKIYFVRGKLTAEKLGLDSSLGITDPAILIRNYFPVASKKTYKKSYMPHHFDAIINGKAWQEICSSLGVHYIDPTDTIENVLKEISETEILFTEAMHGAIIADAFRVPWVPIKTSARILGFKWQDWLSSYSLEYRPFLVRRKSTLIEKNGFLKSIDFQSIRLQMLLAFKTRKGTLSLPSISNELEFKILNMVDLLKHDIANQNLF